MLSKDLESRRVGEESFKIFAPMQVASPEIIYMHVTLNRLSKLYLYI